MILPSSQESALPSKPRKEPFNQPSPAIASKLSPVLRLVLLKSVVPVWGYHLNAFLCEFLIKGVAVVCLVSNQLLGLCLDHIKLKRQLHKGYLMMIRRMRSHRDRKAVSIYNSHYFHALATLCLADPTATALGRTEHRIDETLPLVYVSLLAQRIGQIGQNIAKHVASAPLLKPSMNRLVVRITLRQHVPLCPRVQNP